MTDRMQPIPLKPLLEWIFNEFNRNKSIFGIPAVNFYKADGKQSISLFNEQMATPVGPAAGPHTQMAQNIVAAYLCGGRFFELKTVQIMDKLEIAKPCIDATDEGYNTEWSQELTLDQSFDEYLKAWIILHLLEAVLGFTVPAGRSFIFNISIGYDLAGIQQEPMDRFIQKMMDASNDGRFSAYISDVLSFISNNTAFQDYLSANIGTSTLENIKKFVKMAPSEITRSVTLSTMHGCPPEEIEAIAAYLLDKKGLHTFVKLNPTLLGFDRVRQLLDACGYNYIQLQEESFSKDLSYKAAVPMLQRLMKLAEKKKLQFGVKLSNTLGVGNDDQKLAGTDKYMSGRALYPLTINLAARLSRTFDGKLPISYSGGANELNVRQILSTGIYPVTVVTDLLKPGGYLRLARLAELSTQVSSSAFASGRIDTKTLDRLAARSSEEEHYRKSARPLDTIKNTGQLPLTDCYVAPCTAACPIEQDVAEYLRLIERGDYLEAFATIVRRNPLPHITGYICDHQCQYHCTRWDYDSTVQIRDMKKEAALRGYDEYMNSRLTQLPPPAYGPVAVIGAGPAGLSAAYFLARAGFRVTVFDKKDRPGGVVRHIIPGFRLPQSAIDRDVQLIQKYGVEFRLGISDELSVEMLKSLGYHYIFLGIGAPLANRLRLQSSDGPVLEALDFLEKFNKDQAPHAGRRVAVIGGGNSAMDAARAAKRLSSVDTVSIIYRRTKEQMPADLEEFEAALEDGVIFRELLLPLSFENGRLICQKMRLTAETGADGRRKVEALPGEKEQVEVDTLVAATGERVDMDYMQRNGLLQDGRLVVDPQTGATIREGVYIGGDARRGPSTVVESIADGRQAAEAIIRQERVAPAGEPVPAGLTGAVVEQLTIRKGRLAAPQSGAAQEAARCLQCHVLCNKCVDVCPNRANVAIKVDSSQFRDKYQIVHLHGLCNECGNCETFCPWQGAPWRDKFTLFWDEREFNNSPADGLVTINRQAQRLFKIRLRGHSAILSEKEIQEGSDALAKDYPGPMLQVTELVKILLKEQGHLFILNGRPGKATGTNK